MQAVVYTEYGPPEVLRAAEVETPVPKDNEILIKVHATPIGYGDLVARNFRHITLGEFNMPALLMLPTRLAFGWRKPKNQILGSEFAGDVEAVGAAVTRFKAGDPVYGYRGMNFGAYAEYLVMREDGSVTHKPANLTFEEAATLPYGTMMALNLLRKVNIQPGHKVLVNGASGSIGSGALQLAKHYGAEVTGVCGTPRMDYVKALGADHVIDYTQQDFTQNGETYDLIFDVLGKSSFARCKNSLAENGRYLLASFKLPDLLHMLRTSFVGRKKVICALSGESYQDLDEIRELTEEGKITAVIDRTFPLEQAAEAHRYVESGQKTGSVVLTVGPTDAT
ncbi:MAG: NAD(P)-dependent alcohol dehydrogenase [Chloroflexi bacterium]|nr:NAD(P)-dependent alcohol dehydrogenase [Chloroflexota bacterium]